MRAKISAAVSVFLLEMMVASLAVAKDFNFQLNGVEINPGATNKTCTTGVGGTYTTTGITFVGSAKGDANATWVISLDAMGQLDSTCEPVRCDTNSPVYVTGGTWLLKILLGTAGGSISGGNLQFRPDGPVAGSCLGPVPGELTLAVDLALGRLRQVHNAQMGDILLDHNPFPPRVRADLTLMP